MWILNRLQQDPLKKKSQIQHYNQISTTAPGVASCARSRQHPGEEGRVMMNRFGQRWRSARYTTCKGERPGPVGGGNAGNARKRGDDDDDEDGLKQGSGMFPYKRAIFSNNQKTVMFDESHYCLTITVDQDQKNVPKYEIRLK